jgi:hypothetical protein
MFTINGKNITLSSNDTLNSLKNKISATLGTLPSLLGGTIPTIVNGGNYTIAPIFLLVEENGLSVVKMRGDDIGWEEVERVESLDHNFLKKLYIISKVQLTIEEFGEINADQAINVAFFQLEMEFGSEVDTNVWAKKSSTIKEFRGLIEENKKSAEKQSQSNDMWGGVVPTFTNTSFISTKINHTTEIPNLLNQNELMVFDSIKLNNIIVACFYQDLIKYNVEFKPLIDEYLNQESSNSSKSLLSKKFKVGGDIVRIMLNLKAITKLSSPRTKYKIINIFVRKETITITIETLITEPSVSNNIKNLIKTILTENNLEQGYNQRVEKEFYYGTYTVPINIPLVVLKDLVTNDPNVYNISYINESALINTRKTNINIFLKGPPQSEQGEDIAVSLFERPDTVGTFVRIKKIRGGPNLETRIDSCIVLVNKILQYASTKINPILKYYRQYINLKVEEQTLIIGEYQQGNMLKDKAPEIFLANYTRLCNKPPIIIDAQSSANEEEEIGNGNEVIKFPIYGESEQRIYKCPYPDYKYPGLRENTKLANKNIFPFVPCCYQRPQQNSKNMKMYYNQEVYEQRINTGEIGKTLKILSPKRIGALPSKVNKLLVFTTGNKFYRYGIPTGNASCVQIMEMVTYSRNSEYNIRSELSKRAELCKGELSDLTTKEIAKKIMDPQTYINPRLFKGALEDYYQVSFILFSKDEDDFSTYPNRFIRFICPLKKKVIFLIEHQIQEHVELIVDEETLNYVNKQGKKPIFVFENKDNQVKKIFAMYKERFKYTLYDVNNKQFINTLNDNVQHDNTTQFHTYPWEYVSPNGKILRHSEPLNQYVDGYGQTRLVEFEVGKLNFVGQFQPLPCLKLPIKKLNYFITLNGQLSTQQKELITKEFKWCVLYSTNLDISDNYVQPYHKFESVKRLAEYILWAACYAYSKAYVELGISVDVWITEYTQIVDNFTYSRVTIRPIFNLSELMVSDKFIFNSVELQERIRFNLSLISTVNLKMFESNIYRSFFNDITNFNVVEPAQLALTKQNYFHRTREPYVLNILESSGVQYLRSNTLYFIKDLFGYYSNTLCLFLSSFEKLIETALSLSISKVVPDETIMNVTVFNSDSEETVRQYSVGKKEPAVNIIVININNNWFYGLILSELT